MKGNKIYALLLRKKILDKLVCLPICMPVAIPKTYFASCFEILTNNYELMATLILLSLYILNCTVSQLRSNKIFIMACAFLRMYVLILITSPYYHVMDAVQFSEHFTYSSSFNPHHHFLRKGPLLRATVPSICLRTLEQN